MGANVNLWYIASPSECASAPSEWGIVTPPTTRGGPSTNLTRTAVRMGARATKGAILPVNVKSMAYSQRKVAKTPDSSSPRECFRLER